MRKMEGGRVGRKVKRKKYESRQCNTRWVEMGAKLNAANLRGLINR